MSNINKLSFLDMPAPAGYVPGLGRGATGFTTRSDIGPAKAGVAEDAIKAAVARQGAASKSNAQDDEERFRDPENDSGLLVGSGLLDPEDTEADRIYEAIDKRMEERRRMQREAREKAEQEEFERRNPKISTQFGDLKRALSAVSADEWAALPEVGDLTRKNKRQRRDMERRFYAVPDSVIMNARNAGSVDSSIEAASESNGGGGDGTMTDFRSISLAKDKMLSLRLDQVNNGPGVQGQLSLTSPTTVSTTTTTITNGTSQPKPITLGGASTIDPKGYLTSLSTSNKIASSAEIGDINRVRPLLESLVKTDPKEPRGWIGLARLEELARRMNKARSIIQQGCENCPKNEDVWLENMRLNDKQSAKILAARAVAMIPKSINLWLAAANLEDDINAKKRIIQKALESNPNSDTLWKMAVNLESEPADAKLLLAQAVELVPLAEDLWLALARLETYKNARKVLSKARKALRVSRAVWISAARLEEQEKHDSKTVDTIMARGVQQLDAEGGLPDRALWISDAEYCEREGALLTCQAIIKATISQGMSDEDDQDKKAIWLEDGKTTLSHGAVETARAICNYALNQFPDSRTLWMALVQLEREHTIDKSQLWSTLDKAVSACPSTEEFWLLYSNEKASAGDISGAQDVLARAFKSNPNNEAIWLAAINLEVDNKQYDRATKLLARARRDAGTERIWIKSVVLARQLKQIDNGLELVEAGLKAYPQCAKLHMQKGQMILSRGDIPGARAAYTTGTRACPKSVSLWLLLATLEESQGRNGGAGGAVRGRAVLDRASLVNDKNELIWLHRIRIEKRSNNESQAIKLMAKALQECPKSGLLWSEYIWLQPRMSRLATVVQAVKECEHDPYVLTTVGRYFWVEGKIAKAKTWLERAVKADPDNGDAWLWLYRFTIVNSGNGNDDDASEKIIKEFQVAHPRHGLVWAPSFKDVDNFGKSYVDIFKDAASRLIIE